LRARLSHPPCPRFFPSRHISPRSQLESGSDADRDAIFDELAAAPLAVMTDMFGNYLLQHYLRAGTPDQK
jgi:hypothetical protein